MRLKLPSPKDLKRGLNALFWAWALSVVASPPLAEPRWSPDQRLQRERLAAVDQSVKALAKRRREIERTDTLRDFRCHFHTHAGDSTHTGGTPPEILAAAKTLKVDALFLSDHFRPPRDFMDSWRGNWIYWTNDSGECSRSNSGGLVYGIGFQRHSSFLLPGTT